MSQEIVIPPFETDTVEFKTQWTELAKKAISAFLNSSGGTLYFGVDDENEGLATGTENYWCVNKNAAPEDIQATLDFLSWVITSDEGRESISQEMGFTTPFKTFDENYESANPLVKAADEYVKAGKTPVSWNFTTMPSEEWKNQVGSAMLEYAQGTGEWDAVKTAFVDGWAKEYKAANEG